MQNSVWGPNFVERNNKFCMFSPRTIYMYVLWFDKHIMDPNQCATHHLQAY